MSCFFIPNLEDQIPIQPLLEPILQASIFHQWNLPLATWGLFTSTPGTFHLFPGRYEERIGIDGCHWDIFGCFSKGWACWAYLLTKFDKAWTQSRRLTSDTGIPRKTKWRPGMVFGEKAAMGFCCVQLRRVNKFQERTVLWGWTVRWCWLNHQLFCLFVVLKNPYKCHKCYV